MTCLSKGLGAPVGSMLAGPGDVLEEAWRIRRRFGGAMRQSGILAAAGLHALEHHRDRLVEDHRRARLIAEAADALPGFEARRPQTNVVLIHAPEPDSAQELLDHLTEEGVRMLPFGEAVIRAVTHLDVSDAEVERVLEALEGWRRS
jgi:threonine aldolase